MAHTTTAPVARWQVLESQGKGSRHARQRKLSGRGHQEHKQRWGGSGGDAGSNYPMMGQAKVSEREGGKRRGKNEQREGRVVRRGYTPEPVCGQRCESPHLTSGQRR